MASKENNIGSQTPNLAMGDSTSPKARAHPLPPRSTELSGSGFIGRKTAWLATILFTIPIFAPAVYQFAYDHAVLKRWEFDDLLMQRPTSESLRQFEVDLTQRSRFDQWVRHTYWTLRAGGIKRPAGIEIGSDGFLFTEEESRVYHSWSLTSRSANTILPAIVDFNAQLRHRGVRLVLLPIPLKLSIYPEKLAIDYLTSDGPAQPPGYTAWMAQVRDAGIEVIDLTPDLWQARLRSADPVFLPTDTHWSLRGKTIAADAVAGALRATVAGYPRAVFDVEKGRVDFEGDLAGALSLGWGNPNYPRIQYACDKLTRGGKPFVAGDEAPILLLGDSFSVYWNNDGCGFADDLMLRLGCEVQVMGAAGEPINQPRLLLARNPQALANKKLVIWEFAARYMWKQWQQVPLK
jgi:alginate O-acetyltransferase complex protein AlgJ